MSHTHTSSHTHAGVHQLSPSPPTLPLAQPFLPIQTSPNWPLPSFLISWRDSRGISHISLVFTDKSASLGMPRLQLPIKRQQSPAALSGGERWARAQVKKGGKRREEEENRVEKKANMRDKHGWSLACVTDRKLTQIKEEHIAKWGQNTKHTI